MPTSTIEPRALEDLDVEMLIQDLEFEANASGPQACVETCVSGFTWKCDGKTFNKTCVTGLTWRCDG